MNPLSTTPSVADAEPRAERLGRVQVGRGFTLIELLVVVTILALLIAILMPELKAAREAARRAACASRQHQLQLAFITYAADHRGYLPNFMPSADGRHMLWCWGSNMTTTVLNQYLGGSWQMTTDVTDTYPDETTWLNPTYGYRYRLAGYIATCTPVIAGNNSYFNTGGVDYSVLKVTVPSSRLLLACPLYHTPKSDLAGGVWSWRWNISFYGYHAADPTARNGFNAAGANETNLDGSTRWTNFGEMKLRLHQIIQDPTRQYWW